MGFLTVLERVPCEVGPRNSRTEVTSEPQVRWHARRFTMNIMFPSIKQIIEPQNKRLGYPASHQDQTHRINNYTIDQTSVSFSSSIP